MVPLRAASEALGATVNWDAQNQAVYIVSASTVPPVTTPAPTTATGTLYLMTGDGKVYLGKLTTNKYDVDSVFNEYGTYGSKYSTDSIWNEYGTYGSAYSSKSAFNKYATDPPQIFLKEGSETSYVGYLTKNSTLTGALDPDGIYDALVELGY